LLQRQAQIGTVTTATITTPATPGSSDGVTVLSQVVKDLVESLVVRKPPIIDTIPVTPKSAKLHLLPGFPDNSSPIPPSPSHLRHYLEYADAKLGVQDALMYLGPLSQKGYGPDILAEVSVPDLTDPSIGLTPGDAIHLKRGSGDWWSAESKKKRPRAHTILTSDTEPAAMPAHFSNGQSSTKQQHDDSISYHIEYPDGGGKRWFTGPLLRGRACINDNITEYWDDTCGKWVPIPPGFTALTEPGEELDPFEVF